MDALEWWKQNENELPLLAGVARSYLAVPVTSASLERMFSLGGRLVTDFKHNLNPENTSMLVFVSQNYTTIPSNLKDWEKTCEGEPYELPHFTPPPPPQPEKSQQQGKSKSMTQTQNKTKKRCAPEKAFPTQIPETQTASEPEEQQQLQLETQESQGTPAQQEGNEETQKEDQTQSLTVDSNGIPTKTKKILAKKQN